MDMGLGTRLGHMKKQNVFVYGWYYQLLSMGRGRARRRLTRIKYVEVTLVHEHFLSIGWYSQWSRGEERRRLTLIKTVLVEVTLVCEHSLSYIPIGILEKNRRKCFQFLWQGSKDKNCKAKGTRALETKKYYSSLRESIDNKEFVEINQEKTKGL